MWSWPNLVRLKMIQSAWQTKTPKAKWKLFFNFGKFFTDTLQIRLYSDCRIGWVGWLPAVQCVSYFNLLVYTVYFNISSERIKECLLCFCFIGLMITVSNIYCVEFIEKNLMKSDLFIFILTIVKGIIYVLDLCSQNAFQMA